MKSLLYTLVILLGFTANVYAKRGIPVGKEEVLKEVADLPKTEYYQLDDGSYLDLGIKYERLVFGFPIWLTKEPEFVGISNLHKDSYYELTPEEVKEIAKENNLNLEELKKLGFSEKYLGLALFPLAILLYILWQKFVVSRGKDDIINDSTESDSNKQ